MAEEPTNNQQQDDVRDEGGGSQPLPARVPVLVNAQFVLYPFMIAPLLVQDEATIRVVDEAVRGSRMIGVFTPRQAGRENGSDENPETPAAGGSAFDAIHETGTLAMILRMLKIPDGSLRLLVHGIRRVRVAERLAEQPWPAARVEPVEEVLHDDDEMQAMKKNARELLAKIVEHSSNLPNDLIVAANNTEDPARFSDLIASNLQLNLTEQQEILELGDTRQRLLKIQQIMNRELEIARLGSKIQSQVKSNMDRMQRDYFLREQMKAIRRELGEDADGGNELDELDERIRQAGLPEQPLKIAGKELGRLRSMAPQSAEYTVSRTYLDWILALPWNKATRDNINLTRARKILDEDHYDLEKIKDRILEYLAVIKLRRQIRGPLLCLAGPPGVGKTSLGKSIARAMGRKFVRISLGGVHDEAEIRGHRRTYIGALPGRIIKALKDAESNNPVVMLDEIDKLGSDFRGDPASALLEVLDPEQNFSFADNYMDMTFDLSNVMFITTANSLETIPGPLLDRMEVLRLSGYTLHEKKQIARRYLIPRAMENTGLKPGMVRFTDEGIERVIENYTREAGLRNLEREITSICRKVARRVAGGVKKSVIVDAGHVLEVLGAPRFERDLLDNRLSQPGVAVGMAWTPTGGDILFIEATATPGQGRLVLTGQLGDVMKESAQAARTWLQANARRLKIAESRFSRQDIHIHVPAGAIPKDGPSAGITMLTALASLLTGRPVHGRMSMTGEITLKGTVLPVGGIKEKVLAAHRSGIETIMLPRRNQKDLDDVPGEIRGAIRFHFVENADEVLKTAFGKRNARPGATAKTARGKTPAARSSGRVKTAARTKTQARTGGRVRKKP